MRISAGGCYGNKVQNYIYLLVKKENGGVCWRPVLLISCYSPRADIKKPKVSGIRKIGES